MKDFEVVFENLTTEDLEEYVRLANEELQKRTKKQVVEAWDEVIKAIKNYLSLPNTAFRTENIKWDIKGEIQECCDEEDDLFVGYLY